LALEGSRGAALPGLDEPGADRGRDCHAATLGFESQDRLDPAACESQYRRPVVGLNGAAIRICAEQVEEGLTRRLPREAPPLTFRRSRHGAFQRDRSARAIDARR
jgi:hypothetical protein